MFNLLFIGPHFPTKWQFVVLGGNLRSAPSPPPLASAPYDIVGAYSRKSGFAKVISIKEKKSPKSR